MDLTQESKQHVEQVAKETLAHFDAVATAAQNAIRSAPSLGTDALATTQTFTGGAAIQRLGQISQENLESYQILAREPAIARVAVLDVQHIKGLEFEAVFFIGVDRLASIHPQLFDKYLYVGTTRAATYLGWICDGALPDKISTLRPMFVANW